VLIVMALTGCQRVPPDRRARADRLTQQIRAMPGVVAASADLADNVAQGAVYFWLAVEVADDITGDQLAAITSGYLDELHTVDYTDYQTELDIHRGRNVFTVDSATRAITNTDQIVEQSRNWVALRHELPAATITLHATVTHPPEADGALERLTPRPDLGQPNTGVIELPEPSDYTAVTATVTNLATRFADLAGGTWTISASKTHPADITTSQRLPTLEELAVWNTLNADQTIPHMDAMTINAPQTPPDWMSEKTISRDPAIAVRLAQQHLPIVGALPTPLLYTATDKLQAHRGYNGHVTAPIAITTGGCTPRDYQPDPTEQNLINTYETCRH
jgi:hypothetical protein